MSEELHRGIGRLEGKIDAILANQDDFKYTFEKHDSRLKHLEGSQMKVMGAFGVLVFALNWVWDFIKTKL
jgi:hypothetical protein